MSLVRVTAGSRAHIALRAGTALIVAIVLIAIPFNSNPSLNGNLTLVMSYAVASMGLGLLVGYAGQISLGQGAFFAIGAYAAAAMLAKTGLPYLLALPLAAAVTFAIGLAFGIPAVRLRGLYLALVTLALAVAVGPVIKRAEPVTGGVSGLSAPQPPVPGWLAVDPDQWLYLLSLVVTALMLLLAANLTRGSLGRALVAIRDGERAARTSGVHVSRTKALLFAIAGAYAACRELLREVDRLRVLIAMRIAAIEVPACQGMTRQSHDRLERKHHGPIRHRSPDRQYRVRRQRHCAIAGVL